MGGGREADEVLLPGERGALRGMGRARGAVGSLGRKRKVKALPSLVALSPPGVCAGDNGQTG